MHSFLIFAIWLSLWLFLFIASETYQLVSFISIGVVAGYVTYWCVNGLHIGKARSIIPDTKGKAVFITGCDTGFGHKLAIRLDQLGFKVYAGCLYPNSGGAEKLQKCTSDRLQIMEMDVTNNDQVIEVFKRVKMELEKSGDRLWALVNNAGIAALTEIEWCPLEVYQKVFDVNALGLLRVTKTFLPLIRQEEGSRIIIVTSLAGRYTFPGFSAYSMSKHAAVSFADALRIEMRKWNISVHTVEPTLYRTPIVNEELMENNLDSFWENCPENIRRSYGTEYLRDFKSVMLEHLSKAKPFEKIREVVDDMVDAVAGTEPQCRYVPSFKTQLTDHVLSSLPMNVIDDFLAKSTPKTPPADIEESKKSRFNFDVEHIKNSRRGS